MSLATLTRYYPPYVALYAPATMAAASASCAGMSLTGGAMTGMAMGVSAGAVLLEALLMQRPMNQVSTFVGGGIVWALLLGAQYAAVAAGNATPNPYKSLVSVSIASAAVAGAIAARTLINDHLFGSSAVLKNIGLGVRLRVAMPANMPLFIAALGVSGAYSCTSAGLFEVAGVGAAAGLGAAATQRYLAAGMAGLTSMQGMKLMGVGAAGVALAVTLGHAAGSAVEDRAGKAWLSGFATLAAVGMVLLAQRGIAS